MYNMVKSLGVTILMLVFLIYWMVIGEFKEKSGVLVSILRLVF